MMIAGFVSPITGRVLKMWVKENLVENSPYYMQAYGLKRYLSVDDDARYIVKYDKQQAYVVRIDRRKKGRAS